VQGSEVEAIVSDSDNCKANPLVLCFISIPSTYPGRGARSTRLFSIHLVVCWGATDLWN
jgi:hypothetical protein